MTKEKWVHNKQGNAEGRGGERRNALEVCGIVHRERKKKKEKSTSGMSYFF